jgi:hypothetical protein
MTWIKPTDLARGTLLQSYPYLKLPARATGSSTLTNHQNLSPASSPEEFKRPLSVREMLETFQRKTCDEEHQKSYSSTSTTYTTEEGYRYYVPGCQRAREKKGNLSTHFKTEHIGVLWNIRLVEDPPISPSAAECKSDSGCEPTRRWILTACSIEAGITRPFSTTQNYPDRVAPLKPPLLWKKIFSSDTPSSAANSTVQIFATESGQNDHPFHLVVEDPYIQRHINKAESERQRLGPAPRGLRKAHNRKNAIEDNSEEEDVVELSFEHYRRRAPNTRSTYVPQLPKPHYVSPQVKPPMTASAPPPPSNSTMTSQPFRPVPRPLALKPLRP